MEHHTGRIHEPRPPIDRSYRVEPGQEITLPEIELVMGNLGLDSSELDEILVGRDLFGYGGFEDDAVSEEIQGGIQWALTNKYKEAVVGDAKLGRVFCECIAGTVVAETC